MARRHIDRVGMPDRGEACPGAAEIVPASQQTVLPRELSNQGRGIVLRGRGDGQHRGMPPSAINIGHGAMNILGHQRTGFFATGLDEGEEHRLAPELRERDGAPRLTDQREIGSGTAMQIGADQASRRRRWTRHHQDDQSGEADHEYQEEGGARAVHGLVYEDWPMLLVLYS